MSINPIALEVTRKMESRTVAKIVVNSKLTASQELDKPRKSAITPAHKAATVHAAVAVLRILAKRC